MDARDKTILKARHDALEASKSAGIAAAEAEIALGVPIALTHWLQIYSLRKVINML